MFQRIREYAIFRYAGRPERTLYRHHTCWRAAAQLCLTSAVLAISTTAEFMLSYHWYQRAVPALTECVPFLIVGLWLVALLLTVPMILAFPLTKEICEELARRGLPLPAKRLEEHAAGVAAMRMCLWAIALVLIAQRLKK